jgi:hypothetical protein
MNTKTLYLNKEGFKISTTSFKNHLFAHKVSSNRYQVSTVLLAGQILNWLDAHSLMGFWWSVTLPIVLNNLLSTFVFHFFF